MKKRWINILMYLPLVLAIIAVGFMDTKIPMHYDFAGNVDRWGSRFEIFILPIATIIIGAFLLWVVKITTKKEKNGNNNEKFLLYTIAWDLVIFNVLNIMIIYSGLQKLEKLEFKGIDFEQLMLGLNGLLFIFLGNKMPKIKRNKSVGLVTKWSMANDLVWKKSQRTGGIIFILMGIGFMIFPFIFKPERIFVYYLIFTVLCIIAMIVSTYIIYKKYEDKELIE